MTKNMKEIIDELKAVIKMAAEHIKVFEKLEIETLGTFSSRLYDTEAMIREDGLKITFDQIRKDTLTRSEVQLTIDDAENGSISCCVFREVKREG